MIVLPFAEPSAISRLEELRRTNPDKGKEIDGKLKLYRAGAKAEKDAAYQIDFRLKDSRNYAVLHGLRIEHNGRVCQVDHLVIDRFLTFYTLETKSFHAGFKVTDEGRFLRWNAFRKAYENMPSPFLQSERHHVVLSDVIGHEGLLPKRLGFRIKPRFETLMLVDPKVRVIQPDTRKHDTSRIVSYEEFFKAMMATDRGLLDVAAMGRIVGTDTLEEIGKRLAALHAPLDSDFSYLEAMTAPAQEDGQESEAAAAAVAEAPPERPPSGGHACRHCGSGRLEMLHGKFGYYFRCGECGKNTPPSLPGKGRLRKDGARFWFVPEDGAGEMLFHENA